MRVRPRHSCGVEDRNCKTTPRLLNSARVGGRGNPLPRLRTIRKIETQKVGFCNPADRPARQGEVVSIGLVRVCFAATSSVFPGSCR